MCLAEILEKVENKDINVRFYITSIPKILLHAIYNECEITNDLIRIYL